MAEKVIANGCSPSRMQGAVDRIREDCDGAELQNRLIGNLVEGCQRGFSDPPFASCEASGAFFSANVRFTNLVMGEVVTFVWNVREDRSLGDPLTTNLSADEPIAAEIGDTLTVVAENADGAELATGEAPMNLKTTPDQWEPYAVRVVELMPGAGPDDPPTVGFRNFE